MRCLYFILNILYVSLFCYQSFFYQRLVILNLSLNDVNNFLLSFAWTVPAFILAHNSKSINPKKLQQLSIILPLLGIALFHAIWFSVFLNEKTLFVLSTCLIATAAILYNIFTERQKA